MTAACIAGYARTSFTFARKGVLAGVPRIFTRQQRTIQHLRNAAALAITVVVASGVGYFLSGFAKRFL